MNSNHARKTSWSFYDFAVSAYSITIVSTIIQMFLSLSATASHIEEYSSAVYFSCVTSVSTVLLVVIGILLGTAADFFDKRIILGIFIFGGASSTMLIALVPMHNYMLILFLYLLSFVCYEASRIFYDALLPDAVIGEERQTAALIRASSKGVLMGHLGGVIVFVFSISLILLAQMEFIPIATEAAFKVVFVFSGFWWAVFSLPLLLRCRRHYHLPKRESIFGVIRKSFQNKRLSAFLLAYALFIGAVITLNSQFIDTAIAYGLGTVNLSFMLILIHISAILFTFIYSKIALKIGAKKTIVIGLFFYALACVYLFIFQNSMGFYVVAFILGTAQGGIFALSRAYYADTIEYESASGFFSLYHIVGKFAAVTLLSVTTIANYVTASYAVSTIVILILLIAGAVLLLLEKRSES